MLPFPRYFIEGRLWFHLWLTFSKMKLDTMQFDLKQPRKIECSISILAGNSKLGGAETQDILGAPSTPAPAEGTR